MDENTSHSLHLEERRLLSLTGVCDVEKFEETTAVFRTEAGLLTVDGEGLHILRLEVEKGEVSLEGHFCGLFYSDGIGRKTGLRGKKGS